MPKDSQQVRVDGRRVRVTSLTKVLYPATHTTKAEVIEYLSEIAEVMLPHCADRAATRKRWPNGVGDDGQGESFFQKNLGDSAPSWVRTAEIQHKDHTNIYPLVNDRATLVWLAQLSALEVHVPQWRFDAAGVAMPPDRMVFDLDPGEGVPLRQCAHVAFEIRDLLKDVGLPSVPVTSGGSGIHLYASLDGSLTSAQATAVAKELARSLEADYPDDITSSMKRSLRPGKVFIDWSQNNGSKTTIAPYSLRGRQRPTVAAPRTWRELASPHLRQLEFAEVLKRVQRRKDPLAELLTSAAASSSLPDRLDRYREMRDPAKTPEPVPKRGERNHSGDADSDADPDRGPDSRPRFVIQRHEARRLHYDFRLERDGVLVSWAIPKGVPTDPKRNHLAVPTEDHPMSYRHFEGEIPKGQYGAGKVRIWDSGTYEIEKWRDDEVTVTLTGQPEGGLGGTRTYALFRTGARDGKPQWMIHLKASDLPAASKRRQRSADRLLPMLCETGTPAQLDRLDPEEWSCEMKWDGMRALARCEQTRSEFMTRSGQNVTESYPELADLAASLHTTDAVLDGEIVALGPDGTPSFSLLQQRFGVASRRAVERLSRTAAVSYLVFDVLQLNGKDCRDLRYEQRRELLESIVAPVDGARIALPEVYSGSAVDAMAASQELGLEGIVTKRVHSRYHSGVRSRDWLKFPLIHTTEAVVMGWRASDAVRVGIASLLLATREPTPPSSRDGADWRYTGRVGTGFSLAERRAILDLLTPHETSEPATEVPAKFRQGAHWVQPELVAEVVSKGFTDSGHLRQPVWRGWRPDKSP
jgi:bifunctional non-homologous end joining protein LigD